MVRARVTLPKLLATLPSFGQGQLVQPTAWAERFPQSFYKITRSKLRFLPVEGGSASGSGLKTKDEVLGKGKQPVRAEEEDEDGFEEEEDMFGAGSEEGEAVQGDASSGRPHGKAWGVLVWNGQPKIVSHKKTTNPTDPSLPIPSTLLRSRLTQSWTSVDPSTLSSNLCEALDRIESDGPRKLDTGYRFVSGQERRRLRREKKERRREEERGRVVGLPEGEKGL